MNSEMEMIEVGDQNTIVIYSSQDLAGTGIARCLKDTGFQPPIVKTDNGLLYCESDLEKINAEFIFFASKHKSESGAPSFTVHIPGNWNSAEMGGKPRQISMSDPIWMKAIAISLESIRKKASIEMGVGMEVDHHGPLTMKPGCFVEIGSTEKEWKNEKYAAAVAAAITQAIDEKDKIGVKEIAFGIGGGHYCPAFNKMELEGSIALAHVMPRYVIEGVTFETFMQGIERSTEEVDVVLVDWKGLKADQREKILAFINDAGIEWRKV